MAYRSKPTLPLAISLLLVVCSAGIPLVAAASWNPTGSMTITRERHTATLLPNGQVLVVGGLSGDVNGNHISKTAELYDPHTGTWSLTGSMAIERQDHTATLLPNGKVLIAGGGSSQLNGFVTATVELLDPQTGTWSSTASLNHARFFHTATLLTNGKVLVAGGYHSVSNQYPNIAELYDPASGVWAETGGLVTARDTHTATILQNGKVLLTLA